MKLSEAPTYMWTDNTTVLSWILDTDPGRWPVFVANRVAEIQRTIKILSWQHVSTDDNPAGLASRGRPPKILAIDHLWWHGPPWLSQEKSKWPLQETRVNVSSKESTIASTFHEAIEDTSIHRFSKLESMQRVIARSLRLRVNLERIRHKVAAKNQTSLPVKTQ